MTTPREVEQFMEELGMERSIQSRGEEHHLAGGIGMQTSTIAAFEAGTIFTIGSAVERIPEWSIYPALRDRALRRFYKSEPIIAGAVYSMSTRIKSLPWDITGDESLLDDMNALFNAMDFGNGFRTLVQKTVIDLCTQDNGFFWELIGMGNPDQELVGGVVLGVNYLDPQQCYRSFDPEYPVLYINPITGKRHRLHRSRVVMGSSMPMPDELARGIGYSPVSRALLAVQTMKAIEQYRYEKVSGQFERAIGYGTGVTQATMRQLLLAAQTADEGEGFIRFGKIPFYVSPRKDVEFNILDLASIPDGFDLNTETNIYIYTVALAFGVDAREFWTATTTGATKADAGIQHLKTQGKGLADLITIIEDAINTRIMPEGMTFEYSFQDDEQDERRHKRNRDIVDSIDRMIKANLIDTTQGQAMLIHEGVLDVDILKEAESIAVMPEETEPEQPENVFGQQFQPASPMELEPTNVPPQMDDDDEEGRKIKAILDEAGYISLDLSHHPQLQLMQDRIIQRLALSDSLSSVSLQDASAFHLTLAYAPDIDRDGFALAAAQLFSEGFDAIDLNIIRVGYFNNPTQGALVLTVEHTPALDALQKRIYSQLSAYQLSDYSLPYRWQPHITMAYIPQGIEVPQIIIDPFTVRSNAIRFQRDGYIIHYEIIARDAMLTPMERSIKTQQEMERQLRSAARAFVELSHTETSLISEMDSIIRRQYNRAANEAAKEVGMTRGDFTNEEIGKLQQLIADEQEFVIPFVRWLGDLRGTDKFAWSKVFDRIQMWANRYVSVRSKFLAIFAKNKKLKWVVGNTEHCIDCFTFDGMVFRASVWENRTPRSHELACGGFRCQCDLVITNEPASRGRPPAIKGRKKLHDDKYPVKVIGIERMLTAYHSPTGDKTRSQPVFNRFWIYADGLESNIA